MIFILGGICILVLVAGLVYSNWSTYNADNTPQDTPDNTSSTGMTNTDNITDESTPDDDTGTTTDTSSTAITFSSTTVEEELENNKNDHEDDEDYTWDSSAVTTITLNENSINADVENDISIDGTTVTITSSGTYSISGTLNDGQIIVDTNDEETVRLILNGATITSTTNAPIYVANADKTVIVLATGTENYLADNQNNEENATILSKDDLTLCGDGVLTIIGNDNDAIHSNDGLVIESGTITVTSVDDGICGKDYLVIKGGDITVNSIGDGLKASNDEEEGKGYILIEDGTITVTSSQGDAITAQTDLLITGGTFTLTSGGGCSATIDKSVSTKGLKSGVKIIIDNGDFTINSSDDAIHSNDVIILNNGTFDISSGDDGTHADNSIEINGGTIDITQSFEGLESAIITINSGNIQVKSSNDGINLAEADSNMGGMPGEPAPSENCLLIINGGYIVVDSTSDGVDSNGNIEMNDGVLIVNGPTNEDARIEAAIDFGLGDFTITGGTVVAVGRSEMAETPTIASTQNSVTIYFSSQQPANTLVNIQTDSGEDVLTFCSTKTYDSLVFSSPDLETGTYNVYVGGSSTGTISNGVYEDGTYSGGSQYTSFSITEVITTVGMQGERGPPRRG